MAVKSWITQQDVFIKMKIRGSKGLHAWRWLPQVLSVILALPPSLGAQQSAGVEQSIATKPMAPLPMVQSLRVITLAGNGEMNELDRKIMAPLVVDILDRNDRPVEGADVVFRFPLKGPGASFSNGEKSRTVRTNADGQAAAMGWMANSEIGRFQVHVTASRGNELGETVISMANVGRIVEETKSKRKSGWSSRWVKIAIVAGAAGAAAGIILATQGGGSTPTVSASPGSPTIGGPR
jgi:hypothetical protein